MRGATMIWPHWLPQVLRIRRMYPSCTNVKFKPAELRSFDGLLGMFALRPVRCKFCWRRYYWISLRDTE